MVQQAKPQKKETATDKVISLWGGLRHLRQKAVQVIFALVDIVMEHKCPIKAEVIYDKKTKQPLMVAGRIHHGINLWNRQGKGVGELMLLW